MRNKLLFASTALLLSLNTFGEDLSWDSKNDPEKFGKNLETNLSKLPRTGKLERLPWSGDYWPTYKGGITYRWKAPLAEGEKESSRYAYRMLDLNFLDHDKISEYSPAEKYDIFIGAPNFPLTTHERNRTNILKTVEGTIQYDAEFKIPTWEGLCHAWAPATVLYNNPEPVTLKNKFGVEVSFGSSDIKALLTYFLHTARGETSFLGSRCELSFKDLEKEFKDGKITEKELLEKIESSECADTHPAAFHIALINQIGIKKESFIVDMTRDAEVWNQAVYSYSTQYYPKRDGISEGAPEGTVKEIYARTNVNVIVEVPQTWEKEVNNKAIKTLRYTYSLALDKENNIIGGKWFSRERPDFIWKQTLPKFSGFFAPLKEIYSKSVSYLYKERVSELKKLMLKEGKKNLIRNKFLSELNKKLNIKKLKDATKALTNAERFINNVARSAMEKKIRKDFLKKKLRSKIKSDSIRNAFVEELNKLKNIKKVKKSSKKLAHASLFINAVKTDVKINKAKEEAKKKLKSEFLMKKFISETKKDVNKSKALEALKKKMKNDFNAKKFVSSLASEAKKTKAKKTLKSLLPAKRFLDKTKKAALITKLKRAGNSAIASSELTRLEIDGRDQRALNNKFFEAVRTGNVAKAKSLADQGAQVSRKNLNGENALMISLKTKNYGMFLYLIGNEDIVKEINAVDRNGQTALVYLVHNNTMKSRHKVKYVEKLLSKGLDVNIRDKKGKTAYRHSLKRGLLKEFTMNRFFRKIGAKK